MQYIMLLLLLAAAFLLPGYGIRKYIAKTVNTGTVRPSDDTVRQTDDTEQPDTQSETAAAKGTIVIDAGHGGDDPGMIGSSGINEKVLNLVYAQKLETLLSNDGYRVVQTRSTEDGLYDANSDHKKAQDMQRRCAVIEAEQPLLTVSIHQNSYPDDSVKGPQVFYYEQSAEGEKLATAIQNSLNTQLAIEHPRIQKGNSTYYILKRSASVTVIVECGFLSNPQEEEQLQQESYQDQLVKAICDGIQQYLQSTET
jgi:N-acetylmuramoyl-L-alanine amidase